MGSTAACICPGRVRAPPSRHTTPHSCVASHAAHKGTCEQQRLLTGMPWLTSGYPLACRYAMMAEPHSALLLIMEITCKQGVQVARPSISMRKHKQAPSHTGWLPQARKQGNMCHGSPSCYVCKCCACTEPPRAERSVHCVYPTRGWVGCCAISWGVISLSQPMIQVTTASIRHVYCPPAHTCAEAGPA
jgi:hypothetical protein